MRWGQMHWGIDLAAPLGTPIYAAVDGVVLRAGPATGFGNAIYIQDADGNVEIYGHMRYYNVQPGQIVHAGDQIAKVGNQGQSTGPHLHFELHRGGMEGRPFDPQPWLAARGVHV
jgi:murein DD-endopeptidase MepM/ murein hydrolase activator NlpD